ERVRAIFKMYLEKESLLPAVVELERRAWLNKRWTTRKGHERGGKSFTRTSLYKLLTNVAYIGKVRHKDDVYPGEHTTIVDGGIWQRVQAMLERNPAPPVAAGGDDQGQVRPQRKSKGTAVGS